ncbi:PEP-CTERM sorting domain-containing protein [Terriglobus sp.]|uniref:PEP-CTERM sorting domain-containing protein n=1 Tax=Terriglobus sp. TaxID=1889013 RepID=UPI003B00532E
MSKIAASLLFLSLGAASASIAKADAIPYPTPGHAAPEVPTFASSNGGVNIYFYGSTAAFTDTIQVYDIQTKYLSGQVLNNKTTPNGTEVTVGSGPGEINMGDQLVFYINSPDGLFANIASYSDDGVNHGYETAYTGGVSGIPSGLFVGLEDLRNGGDFNYNDDTFVFTGVSAPSIAATPEPGSLALLGTGTLSLLGMARRRFLRA